MKSVQISSQIALVISFVFLTACSDKSKIISEERQAPADIQASFAKDNSSTQIVLKKSSLGKAFLLISSAKSSGTTPQWMDMKPMIVSFERSGQRLAIMELGLQNIYDDIPSDKLIQSFAVVKEDTQSITFEWATGLNSLIVRQPYDMGIFDPNGQQLKAEGFDISSDVKDSLVKDISFSDNQMNITQVSRISFKNLKEESQPFSGEANKKKLNLYNLETTMTVSIEIRPYLPNANFKKSLKDTNNLVGFFTLISNIKGKANAIETMNMKWDTSDERGPVTYAISSDVPEDIVQAVEEGVLYWNKVIGKNVFRVEKGVSNQAFPKDRTVMVRWIKWEDAGFAYAGMQADPLTGELLRGQIFFTSSIKDVFDSKATGQDLSMGGNLKLKVQASSNSLMKLNPSLVCVYDSLESLLKLSQSQGVNLKTDDPAYKAKRGNDVVRLVVAHEVGHTVGLRHNFAGNYSEKNSMEDIRQQTKNYSKDLNHPGYETSTTVMDYLGGMDLLLLGAHIKNNVLPYDKVAMEYLYGARSSGDKNISEYCSDEHIMIGYSTGSNVYGCNRFDAYNSPLRSSVLELIYSNNKMLNAQWNSLLSSIFTQKSEVSDAELDAVLSYFYGTVYSNVELGPFAQMISQRKVNDKDKPYYIGIDHVKSNLEYFGFLLAAGYPMPVSYDYSLGGRLKPELEQLGGLVGVLKQVLSTEAGDDINQPGVEEKELAQFFAKDKSEGLLSDGKPYKLSLSQYEKVQVKMKSIVEQINKMKVRTLSTMMDTFGKSQVDNAETKQKDQVVTSFRSDIGLSNEYYFLAHYVAQVVLATKEIRTEEYAGKMVSFPIRKWESQLVSGLLKLYSPKIIQTLSPYDQLLEKQLRIDMTNVLKQVTEQELPEALSYPEIKKLASEKAMGLQATVWMQEQLGLYESYLKTLE